MTYLAELNDQEFRDEIAELMFDKVLWVGILEPEIIDRSRTALTAILIDVEQQLFNGGDRDEVWKHRTQNFKFQVVRRLARVKDVIRERDRANEAKIEAWKEFALDLADALLDSDMEVLLDSVSHEGRTARQWLEADAA